MVVAAMRRVSGQAEGRCRLRDPRQTKAHAALTEAIAEFRAVGLRATVLFAPDVVQAINSDLGSGIVLAAVLMPEPERNQWLQDVGP